MIRRLRAFLWPITYQSLIHLAVPFIILRLWWRGRKNPAYRQRIAERFACFSAFEKQPRLCLHAVSVGEVIAAKPLINAILQQFSDYRLLVTTTTPTGSATVKRLFAEQVEHVYFPYDLPYVVGGFLQRTQPAAVIIMETEIWPNFYRICARKKIPLLLANARLSERSYRAYARLQPFTKSVLQNIRTIAARDHNDVQRFIQLGMDANRVQAIGNIKYDLHIPQTQVEQGLAYRQTWGNRPIWLAASTHAGEDEVLLRVHQQLLSHFPDLLLVLVPRHPERFAEVAALIQHHKLGFDRRSTWQDHKPNISANTSVILGDSLGEMFVWISACDLVFVGGSLIERGGHNPLEAAALAKPVISGQYVFNFTEVFNTLVHEKAAILVDHQQALNTQIQQWLTNPNHAKQAGLYGQQLIAQHGGATQGIIHLLQQTLTCHRHHPNSE